MKTTILAALLLSVALAGCGDNGVEDAASGASPSTEASGEGSSSASPCAAPADPAAPSVAVDLDGDGSAETVAVRKAFEGCPAALVAEVAGSEVSAEIGTRLRVTPRDLTAVRVPGREGDLLLMRPTHPRGGFEAHLYGWADGTLAELTADGEPLFAFVATDAMTTPVSASCVPGGFEVLEAKAHEPVGVMAAWDVFRTSYEVDGNAVTKGATTEVADNLRDRELRAEYADLVDYAFFTDCATG